MTQRHQSSAAGNQPVTESQVRHMGRAAERAARAWKGKGQELQRLKKDAGYITALQDFWTQRAALLTMLASLLQLVKTITVRALSTFVAKDYFREDGQPDGIKFWLGDNFKKHFLAKVEQPIRCQKLRIFELLRYAPITDILQSLGGKSVAITTLSRMYDLIKAQPKGEKEGDLLVDGSANIFFIEDTDGTLWAVYCFWFAGRSEWFVEAHPVASPIEWDDGYQVFSGDSQTV